VRAIVSPASRTRGDWSGLRVSGSALLATVVTLLFASILGLGPVLERFLVVDEDMRKTRGPLWEATVDMAMDHPLTGHGWGTYESAISAYRPRPTYLHFDHAHNEYLEIFAEAGVTGLAIAAWLIVLFWRRLLRTLSSPASPVQDNVTLGLAIGILSVLIHSIADFGLRIPAVALAFVFVTGLFSRISQDPLLVDHYADPRDTGARRTDSRRRRRGSG